MTLSTVLAKLEELKNPQKVIFKEKKFGIVCKNALGIYMKDLNEISKTLGKNSELAIALFETDIYEAKILAGKIFNPKDLTPTLVSKWTVEFNNWEICDTFSMGIYAKSQLAESIIFEYSSKEREFEKRSAFATLASYCMANKEAENSVYEKFFPLLLEASSDDRLYVRKAVNWALRSIGKRNVDLKAIAIRFSLHLLTLNIKSSDWIAKDAIKELKSKKVRMSDYPRRIYRVFPK